MTISMRGSPAGSGDPPQDPQTGGQQAPPSPQQSPVQPPQQLSPTPSTSTDDAQPPVAPDGQQEAPVPVQHDETGQGDGAKEAGEGEEATFPCAELARLDEMISRPRWVVPVLPNGELEVLLKAAIQLCRKGVDVHSEECQRFFREGLTISFTKILTDEAVSGWKFEIHKCILKNAEKLTELCVYKLSQDWFPLLDLLAMVFNPACKFHSFNGSKPSESVPLGVQLAEDELFARPPDTRMPKGWLVDLVNKFGQLGGFQMLLDRFLTGPNLCVPVIAALIRPFGLCYEVLTPHTVQMYFMPIVEFVPTFLNGLTDEELKKESKTEAKNDALSGIIKALKCLVSRIPSQEDTVKNLEIFRLKVILRLLQISSFNGKMNALNEVNKVITSVSYYPHRHGQLDEEDWLTADKMAEWIQENNVLSIVLRDSLHQPQYVEKLEKIIRFMIKEKALSLQDLDCLWEAQAGKHEAIVKNLHDLLAKLAWDFSPEQLDHLFECFQGSWAHATKKQREKLLELIRRLAEDDKEGVMAYKVLGLLWNLAHSDDVPTDIMDQALSAQIKILDFSCSQDRDAQKMQWINRFVEELRNDKWVLPALKQIRDICQLFNEAPQNFPHTQRTPHMYYRNQVISHLQSQHSIVMLVTQNLTAYMNKARSYYKDHPEVDPVSILPDGRFNHLQQVQERLRFLRFLLKDGQLWLCEPQAKQIWVCLAENAIYPCDRENCFKWFSKLMGEEPDLDPEITKDFLEQNILQFDPSLLTENGMNCFERFFKAVNSKDGRIIARRRSGYMMDDLDLIGLDYLWRVVLYGLDEVAEKAIALLKDIYTNLGPRLQSKQVAIHEDLLQYCMDRLKASYDTVSALDRDKDNMNRIYQEASRMIRVMTVLHEYVAECDDAHGEERAILPLARACRGKHLTLLVRFPNQGRQVEDIDIWSHTNESIGSVRRQIMHRVKANNSNLKVDLYVNGELLDQNDDRRLISQLAIRDKTLITAKLSQVGSNMPSSPDSSSDSSAGSPHHVYDGPNIEAENCLPGVLMSTNPRYAKFLFQLADLGSQLQISKLRDCACNLLQLIPADVHMIESLKTVCAESVKGETESVHSSRLEAEYFTSSPAQVVYLLSVTYALLMPAQNPLADDAFTFQCNFVRSGGVPITLSMLTKNNFLSTADLETRRTAYLVVLKICKLLVTCVGHAQVQMVADACQAPDAPPGSSAVSAAVHNHAVVLQQALLHVPNPNAECMTRNVASKIGQHLGKQATGTVPDLTTVRAVQKIAWSASSGALCLVHSTNEDIHRAHEKVTSAAGGGTDGGVGGGVGQEDVSVSGEAMEVLTVCLALCPQALEALNKDKAWQAFIVDLLLLCGSRSVRLSAMEQFTLMATKCCSGQRPLLFFITLLFTVLGNKAREFACQSHEYFQLLCRLLNYASGSQASLPTAEALLHNEITWLKKVRDNILKTGDIQVDEMLLEGHLGVTKELLSLQSAEKKYHIGSENGGSNLIKEVVEDFLFPASKLVIQSRDSNSELTSEQAIPVCSTPLTITAAFDLLVALCTGCVHNLKYLAGMLKDIYYSAGHEQPLVEWEYLPPIGPRPNKGFVGLKNAGATCYMNSVLQQLFMIDPVRDYILGVEGAADDNMEDYDSEEKADSETNVDPGEEESRGEKVGVTKETGRKDYNLGVLKHVQAIFAHLACSRLQYYVPRGFWKHFRLWGEPVNLREQHDALEFFNSLVDSLDEALKCLGYTSILSKVMGGSFADQKICKDCPHRYSREEPFTALNIEIRNQQNLLESLEQYVKGDLLEGANAYHCEKCSKKVDTVKRLCIKKLPPLLAIQLKRFGYDWERECAIKFNDYFEFPRQFDMEPFTVQGLAKIEGELIADESETSDEKSVDVCTKYRLVGVVVHSGQASGGHYYSYILHRVGEQVPKWYKFDDGEVSECKMDDDEEMKNQCFGGEYLGEVFDHMMKRMQYRKQKKWWNAYILFYERMDEFEHEYEKELTKSLQDLSIENRTTQVKMPGAIERCVCKQNIEFMHNRNQFSLEYFHFMRKLLICNTHCVQLLPGHDKLKPEAEELAMISAQLAAKFLFSIGFHTKKTLRGPASEWYDAISVHLRHSKNVRNWFAQNVFFSHPGRFAEYLLECPSSEVRNAVMKVIVFLAHFSLPDGPVPESMTPTFVLSDQTSTLSDHLLVAVLSLLKKEVSEHGRHLTQYFHLFLMYLNLGTAEKQQLLRLSVPASLMLVALDEGPGPPIKYQYAELAKLYAVVSQLIRCCDVSSKCQSSVTGQSPQANPHGDASLPEPLMPIQPQVAEILFNRGSYVKKLIEECNSSEETTKLLKYCSWENPHFSSSVLSELLWQVAYSYTYELRPYLDLLLQMLLLEDSWQHHRIHNALKGIPDDRDGLFDTIQRSKNHYQKRAYQCIKMMVLLFTHCSPATQMLQTNVDLRRKWTWAVEWLNEELERRHYSGTSQYPYSNWSPPAQSNETSNGYFLERSHSARVTLAKACELVPEEEPEEQEGGEDKEPEAASSCQQAQPPTPRDDKVKVPASTHTLSPPTVSHVTKQCQSTEPSMQVEGIVPTGQPPNVESTESVTTSKVKPSTPTPPLTTATTTTTTTTTTDSATKVNDGTPPDNVGGSAP